MERIAACGFAMMISLEPHADGTILPVRAQPGRGGMKFAACRTAQLKVCVTQAPEKGKANKAVMELLAKKLGLKKSQIELLSGETSHQKRFLVRNQSQGTGRANLKAARKRNKTRSTYCGGNGWPLM